MKRVTKSIASPAIPLAAIVFLFSVKAIAAANVTYDHRSLSIGGRRQLIKSGDAKMWPSLVQTAKEGGCNAIESYVFWNGHEPSPGKYYFGGRYDIVKFIKIVQQAGMHMILRIGPFVAAEWNYGGVPVWLHYVSGTVFRADNEPWKVENQVRKLYCINKAEDSFTHRHLCEFIGLDVELAINKHYSEIMDIVGELFPFIFTKLEEIQIYV